MAEVGQPKGELRRKSGSFAYPCLSTRVVHCEEDRFEKDKVHNDSTRRAAGLQEKGEKDMHRNKLSRRGTIPQTSWDGIADPAFDIGRLRLRLGPQRRFQNW